MPTLAVVLAILIVVGLLLVTSTVKIVQEYERGVIFRLGRLVGARGPGLFSFADGENHATPIRRTDESNVHCCWGRTHVAGDDDGAISGRCVAIRRPAGCWRRVGNIRRSVAGQPAPQWDHANAYRRVGRARGWDYQYRCFVACHAAQE